jgi:DNA-binding NarL/FixJ family response regulator
MSKIRVALIEHHDLTRVGIRRALLQSSEIEVVGEAANAIEGLQMLLTAQPDIAIIDISLPDQDGIELTRQIKAGQDGGEGPQTKVLILTLRDNFETVVAALAAGADSYCMKNITLDNLLEALRVTYRGNAWIDPAIASILRGQPKYEQN